MATRSEDIKALANDLLDLGVTDNEDASLEAATELVDLGWSQPAHTEG